MWINALHKYDYNSWGGVFLSRSVQSKTDIVFKCKCEFCILLLYENIREDLTRKLDVKRK